MTLLAQDFAHGQVLRENLKNRAVTSGLEQLDSSVSAQTSVLSTIKRPSANPTVMMDAAKPAELGEHFVVGEGVQPSDDGYDTSSAEMERPPKRFCGPPLSS